MSLTTGEQVKAWLEPTKLQHPDSLDVPLCTHAENEVLARISSAYDITGWTNDTTTPPLVQTIIAKLYAGWYIQRQYSEDNEVGGSWAATLLSNAEMLIAGIIEGSIQIPTIGASTVGEPSFYPNDNSSIQDPRDNDGADTSLGDSKFSMGTIF